MQGIWEAKRTQDGQQKSPNAPGQWAAADDPATNLGALPGCVGPAAGVPALLRLAPYRLRVTDIETPLGKKPH